MILAISDGYTNNDVNCHGFLCEGSMESKYGLAIHACIILAGQCEILVCAV